MDVLEAMEFRLGHRPELDGLRGLAVLSVMLGHCSLIGARADLSAETADYLPLPSLGLHEGLLYGGIFGVDIFYVLSGFLISSILLQEYADSGRVRLGAFYARRALRLLPAILMLLAACTLYVALSGDTKGSFGFRPILLALAYLANFARGFGVPMGMLTHTWSLSLEEQFYLVWPLTLLILLRFPRRMILGLVVFGAVFSAILRFGLFHYGQHYLAWGSLPARADGLLFGIAVALMARWGWLANGKVRSSLHWMTWVTACMLFALLVLVHGGSSDVFRGWYFIASITTAAFVAGLISNPPILVSRVMSWRPLTYSGRSPTGYICFTCRSTVFSPGGTWRF